MDLSLHLKEAAKQLGAHATSVANCEAGRTAPALWHLSKVIKFLGYDPRPELEAIGGRPKRHREGLGVTQKKMAELLGIDPSTLAGLENDRRAPTGEYWVKVEAILRM